MNILVVTIVVARIHKKNNGLRESMVPGAGLEPAQCFHRRILSPLRLPISPPGHTEGGFLKHYLRLYEQRRARW